MVRIFGKEMKEGSPLNVVVLVIVFLIVALIAGGIAFWVKKSPIEISSTNQIPMGPMKVKTIFFEDGKTKFIMCDDLEKGPCWSGVLAPYALTIQIEHDGLGQEMSLGTLHGWPSSAKLTEIVQLE